MTDGEFLNWVADRFVNRYNEDENVDFVLALRRIAKKVDIKDKVPGVYPNPNYKIQYHAGWVNQQAGDFTP